MKPEDKTVPVRRPYARPELRKMAKLAEISALAKSSNLEQEQG